MLDLTSNDEISCQQRIAILDFMKTFSTLKIQVESIALNSVAQRIPQNKESHFILIGIEEEKNRKASNENR